MPTVSILYNQQIGFSAIAELFVIRLTKQCSLSKAIFKFSYRRQLFSLQTFRRSLLTVNSLENVVISGGAQRGRGGGVWTLSHDLRHYRGMPANPMTL